MSEDDQFIAAAGTVWRDPITHSTWRVTNYKDMPEVTPGLDLPGLNRLVWCQLVEASPNLPEAWRDYVDRLGGMYFYPHAVAAAIRRNGGVSL